ncbi:CBS domain-containing protein [Paracraurococcus lichenis]|uniref:CBS domain-containing protein n=1 Tax=Paracraurococcus lichenis TaxID=3064888 RepID=A0ABT9E091_9PROT|nr:CBS domain-containing protein [Paracraurococcus sp. LOR1-02]MDO9709583.1 CBS domain-containing protein [Paracraurococcus sp. LOR1-02]
MKVRDVMTRKVVSVPADAPVMAVARLLAERGISAVPVTDSWGMLLGIVSEADLIRRLSTSDAPEPGFLRALFYDRDQAAARYATVHGATAGDIMTRDLVTVTEEVTVEHAAHLLETHNVRRLPVVQDGVLVGILSRADLLRALLAPAADTSDGAIRAALTAEIHRLPWADAPYVFFEVAEGVVTLYGFCHSAAVRRGLVAIAAGVPGVQTVEDRITDMTPARRFA